MTNGLSENRDEGREKPYKNLSEARSMGDETKGLFFIFVSILVPIVVPLPNRCPDPCPDRCPDRCRSSLIGLSPAPRCKRVG